MGVLEAASQFVGGAARGVGPGMDLYQQYQTIQDENQKRQKKQMFETKIQQMSQSGGFDDPIKGTRAAADYARELGDMETYLAYNDRANGLQKTSAQREGMLLFQAANSGDFSGAVERLNSMNQILNTGAQYDLQKTPTGYRAVSNTNGKKAEIDLAGDEDVKGFFLSTAEPYLFEDMGDYMNSKTKSKLAEAEIAQGQSATQLAREKFGMEQQLLPGELAKQQAQIGSYGASAAASMASAEQNRAETAALPERQRLQATESQARIANLNKQTENIGQAPDPDLSLAIARTAPPEGLPGDPIDPAQSQQSRMTIASSIKAMGTDTDTAIGMTDGLMQSGQFSVDPKTNTVYDPAGTPIKMAPQGWQELLRVQSMKQVKAPE